MPLVLELPDMGGQPGAGLVTVPAVALVLGDPVPDLSLAVKKGNAFFGSFRKHVRSKEKNCSPWIL